MHLETNNTVLVHTHIDVPNYGANLQALTTKLFLESLGLKVTYAILNPPGLDKKYKTKVSSPQRKLHEEFIYNNFTTTTVFTCTEKYSEYLKETSFGYHVTGSDAVFRLSKDHDPNRWDLTYPNPFWLNGLNNKISLSASAMGTNLYRSISFNQRQDFAVHMNTFKLLSVRDEWTRVSLQKFGVKATIALDPVFLLNKFLPDNKISPVGSGSKYIVASFPYDFGQHKINQLKKLFDKSGIDLIEIGTPESPIGENLTPLEWYNLIANSQGYIGTRFHPLVVAIANSRPVFCLDRYARHFLERRLSKSFLLLKEFGLTAGYCDKVTTKVVAASTIHKHIMKQFDYENLLNSKIDSTLEAFKSPFKVRQ